MNNVIVKIEKLNPSSETIYYKNFMLMHNWEEITVTRFNMLSNGQIMEWNTMPKKLIKDTRTTTTYLRGAEDGF